MSMQNSQLDTRRSVTSSRFAPKALVLGTLLAAFLPGAVPVAVAQSAHGPYANCTAAKKDGRYNIPKGDPDYWSGGDRDNDGIACEA